MAGGGRGNKTVCKFFQEGRCRYGSNCRFYHPTGNSGYGNRGEESYRGNQSGNYNGQFTPRSKDSGRGWGQKNQGGNRFQLFSERDDSDNSRGYQGGGGQRGYQTQGYRNNRQYDDRNNRSTQQFKSNWNGDTSQSSRNPFDRLGPRSSGNNYGRGGGRNRDYGTNSYQQRNSHQHSNEGPRDIATCIRIDMEDWIKSAMWPLSCYSHAKESPCMLGLVDLSPEEVRWEAYQAKATGSSAKYLQGLSALTEKQNIMRTQYGHITEDDVLTLQSNPSALLNDSTSSSLFGRDDSGSLFKTSNTSTSLFGDSSKPSLFGPSDGPKSSLFGPSNSGPTVSSMFGGQDTIASQPSGGGLLPGVTNPPIQQQGSLFPQTTNAVTNTQAPVIPVAQTKGTGSVKTGEKTLKDILNYNQTRELTKLELEAYGADKFVLGKIPEHAPPLQ